jgi:alpha-L-rhamnosidase
MTSFNHYALGAVASFLHTTVAGLKPLEPGYRKFLIAPRPGGTITTASTHTITPYGRASVSWSLSKDQSELTVKFEVPPNTEAVVRLGQEKEETVGSGMYERVVKYTQEGEWPPSPYQTKFAAPPSLDTLAL